MSQNKEVGASEHGLAVTETREDKAGRPKFQEKEVNECELSSLLSSKRQSGWVASKTRPGTKTIASS